MTNLAYFLTSIIPTLHFSAALGLSQLLSPSNASKIQLAYHGKIFVPIFSIAFPLSLCSCIITIFTLGFSELRKQLLSFAMHSGSLRPQML